MWRLYRAIVTVLFYALFFCAAVRAGAAEVYPVRPVRLVVGFAAGGAEDLVARAVGERLSALWSQPVAVINRVGADGLLAARYVAESHDKGYTLLLTGRGAFVREPALITLLRPVSPVATSSNVLVVSYHVKAASLAQFISLARTRPGSITYASTGAAGAGAVTARLLQRAADIPLTEVGYSHASTATTDLLAGRVSAGFPPIAYALPYFSSHRLRPLAITGGERSSILPDVPTFAELGFHDIVVENWYGIFASPDAPAAVIAEVNRTLSHVTMEQDLRSRLGAFGLSVTSATPNDLAALVRTDLARWSSLDLLTAN